MANKIDFKIGPGIGISANSLYVVSTSDGAINSGAVIIKGGASIGRTLSLSGSLLLQNGSNYTALKSSASSNTIYTLPSQYPSIGTSVLQSDTTGQMTWVPMVASAGGGSGSGTVDYGLQYSLATYPSAGTLVTNSDVSYNPITTKLSFSNITFVGNGNSAISISGVGNGGQILTTWSTLNSGLSLDALNASLRIVGDSNAGTTLVDFGVYDNSGFPTGNWNSKYLFPKSTSAVFVNGLSITNTTASTSSSSGALTVLGGVGIGQTLFTSSSYANSLSGVVLNNSVITSGTWAGSTITTLYGGTGLSAFTKGDLLVGLGDTLYKLPAGTQGQLLQAFSSATSGLAWTSITPPTYGAFYSTQTQTVTGSGVSTPITLNSTYEAYNTQIYGGSGTSSRIQVQTSGTYNVQFSAQIHLTQGTQPKKGDFWFRINGVDVPQSNTEQTIVGKDNQTVLALNFISYFAANDYFEIIMSSDDQYFSVEALSGLTGPPRPDIPSMIVTVVPVTQIVGSSAGLGVSGIVSVNGLNQYIQYFATGRSGTDFNISSSSQTHTFNIPHAGIGATGLITSQTQTIGGNKTFVNDLIVSSTTVSNSTTSGALVVTGGVGIGGSLNVASATAISGVTINNGVITGNLTGFATTARNINVVSANTSALHYILFSPNATGSGVALSSLSSLTINPVTNVFSIGTGTFAANGISVGASSNTITTSSGQLNLDSVSGQTNLNDNVVISGNLTVQGTTITVDSTISTFVDPVVVLGSGVGGTHSTLDNNQDRGIEFRWSNAGTATTGFFGFSDTDGKFRFIPNASLPSTNVYTGTAGTAIFGTIEATLSGNAAGTAATYTNFYGTLTGTASTSTNVHIASAGNAAGPFYITMSPSATGTGVGLSTDTSLQYNSSTDVLTVTNISGTAITASTSFSGQLFGNVTGTASTATYAHQSGYGITAGVATTATNIHISSTGNAVGPFYFAMTTVSSGSGVALSTDTALQYNSATDVLSLSYLTGTAITATTSFSGPLIGNVTGTATTSTNVHLSNATTNLAHRLVFSPQSTGSGVALSSSAQVSYNPATFVLSTSGLAVTSSTNSSASNAGALIVTGGVGVGQSVSIDGRLQLFSGGNYTAFVSSASGNTVYTLPAASPATGSSVLQSTSAGVMSWVPLVASASGTTAQNIVVNSAGSADVFHQILITPSQLASGSAVSSDSLLSYNASSDRLFASGISVTSGTASTSTFTGALLVNGGLGVSGQVSFTRASLGFTGVTGTPTMAFIGATTASYISLNVLSDNSLSFEGSSGQLFTIDNNLSIGEIFSVSDISGLPIISASAGQTVILNEFGGVTKIGDGTVNTTSTTNAVLSVIGGLGVTGNAFIGGTTSITNSAVSTSTSTGALVVTGGVGIGGSLYTSSSNASSVSGIVVSNSVVRTGTWAATAITSFYGGTGHSTYTAGDLLVGAGGTLAKLAAGLSGYVLTSNGAGTVPSWQAVPPAAASSVAVTTSTLDQSFFITFVNTSSGSGLGLTTATSFVINPSSGLVTASGLALTNLSNSTSTTSGALRVSGGLGLTGNAFIGGTINAPSINQSNISNVYFTNGNITGTSVTATTIQGTLVGTATTATNIHLASTGNVAGPFYFAMSASSTGSGVALSSDTSLSYNSSTDVMTVPYVSGTAITASTSFSGQLFGNVTGTATTATNIHLASTGNVAGPFYLTMSSRSTGSGVALSSDTSLAYNSLTDVLTVSNISGAAITASTSFSGPLFGDVTGTATTATYAHQSGYGITAGIATTARNIHLASTGNVAGPFYLTMSASSAGSGIALSTDTSLSYNSATDVFTVSNISGSAITASTSFSGQLFGNVTGTATTARNSFVNAATTASDHYLIFSPNASGSGVALSSGANLVFNPSLNILSIGTGTFAANGISVGAALNTITTASGNLNLDSVSGQTNINDNVVIQGNLTVQGTTITVDSTVSTFVDPVVVLGSGVGGTHSTLDNNQDRGIEFRWSNSGTATTGFFGFTDGDGKFRFIPNASITSSNVYSGVAGTAVFGTVEATLSGNSSGTASTYTNFYGSLTGTATTSTNVHLASTGNAVGPFYLAMSSGSSGAGVALSSDTALSYNSATDVLTVTNISGTAITASTSFSGQLFGNVTGIATTATYSYQSGYGITAGIATTATNIHLASTGNVAGPFYLTMSSGSSGSGLALSTDTSLAYNSATDVLTVSNISGSAITAATSFSGQLFGNVTGIATTSTYSYQAGYGITAGIATTARNINVSNATTNAAHPMFFGPTATGSGVAVSSNTTLSYNPSSFILSTSGLAVTSTTVSTNATSGALIVSGGVGIGGTLNIDGNVKINFTNHTAFNVADVFTIYPVNNFEGANIKSNYSYAFNVQDKSNNNRFTVDVGNNKTILSGNTFSHELRIYNVNQVGYTGFVAASTGTVTYTLPAGDGSANFLLTTNGSGVLSWANISGLAVTNINGLTSSYQYLAFDYSGNVPSWTSSGSTHTLSIPIAGTGSTGLVSTQTQSFAGSKTFTNDVFISSATASTWAVNGALRVQGGLGVSGQLSFNQAALGYTGASNPSVAFIGGSSGSPITLTVLSDNSLIFEGTSGKLFGINNNLSTGWIFNVGDISGIPLLRANADGNVAMAEFAGNVGVGLSNPAYKLHVTGSVGFTASTQSTTTSTGALIVTGGVGIGQSVSVGGRLQLFNGSNFTAFVSSATGNTVYTLPATSPATGSSVLSSTSGGVLSWVPMTSGSSSGTVNAGTANFAAYYATSTSAVSENANLQFTGTGLSVGGNIESTSTRSGSLYVSGGLGVTGNAFIGGTTTVQNSASSVSSSTGALVVSGGVGIGGSLFAATSIAANSGANGLSLQKAVGASLGAVYSTNVSPSVSNYSLATDGNNLNLNSVSNLYLNISNTVKATLTTNNFAVNINVSSSNSTSGAFTVSGGAGIAGSLYVGNASRFESSAASISSGTGALTVTGGVGIGGSLFVANNSRFEANTSSISSGTGALTVTGGVGIGGSLYVANASRFESSNASTSTSSGAVVVSGGVGIGNSVSIGGRLQIFNGANYTAFVSAATGNTVYTLPATSPATGTSVLQSNDAGVMSWVPMITSPSGAGSGTVAIPGAQFQIAAYYSGTGASVSGSSTFTNNTTNQVVNISHTTNSTNPSNGALTVTGGVGVGGSISALGSLQLFSGVNYTAFVSSATASTVYTLPATSPATGTSVLQSTSGGILSWVPLSSSSASVGGILDGSVQFKLGSGFAGTRDFYWNDTYKSLRLGNFPGEEITSSTSAALLIEQAIGSFNGNNAGNLIGVNALSTFTGDLINLQTNAVTRFRVGADGGLGVSSLSSSGNANITSTTNSTDSSNGALVVAGGVGIGKTLSVASNIQFNGTMYGGNNTFAKNLGNGDISLDNGTSDTPSITFYWGNNRNIGIDTYWAGSGATRFRITKELNESGGGELWSVDRNGIVTQTAWDVGEVINTRVYNNTDLNMSATTTINSTTYTNVANITYTPKSTTSYLWIEFDAHYDFSNGTTADDFFSRITVGGSAIVEKNQIMVGQIGGGTRSGTIFPISGRYTNTTTSGIAISVQAKWGSADDAIRVYGSSTSGYMRIQEIGR